MTLDERQNSSLLTAPCVAKQGPVSIALGDYLLKDIVRVWLSKLRGKRN